MTQGKNNSLVKEFQKVLLDDKDFLKDLCLVKHGFSRARLIPH